MASETKPPKSKAKLPQGKSKKPKAEGNKPELKSKPVTEAKPAKEQPAKAPVKSIPEQLEAAVFVEMERRGEGKLLDPTVVARSVGGSQPDGWSPLMVPLRQILIHLTREGRIGLYRKGKPVALEDLRGIYRIGPPHDQAPADELDDDDDLE